MPNESPPGPDYSLKELEAIAWAEARRSSGLTPNGGWRWTTEDIGFAVGVLDEALRSPGFRKAWGRGMNRAQARLWISKALHNRLLDHARCVHRLRLLDDFALDALPAPEGRRLRLDGDDAAILSVKLQSRISQEERREVARRLGGVGIGASSCPRARAGPSRATRARLWVRVCEVLQRLARAEGLTKGEAASVMMALADTLTGGRTEGELQEFRDSVRPLGPARG